VLLLDSRTGVNREKKESADIASAWPRTTAIGGLILAVELQDLDRRLTRIGARLASGRQFVDLLRRRGLDRYFFAAGIVWADVGTLGLAHSEPAEK